MSQDYDPDNSSSSSQCCLHQVENKTQISSPQFRTPRGPESLPTQDQTGRRPWTPLTRPPPPLKKAPESVSALAPSLCVAQGREIENEESPLNNAICLWALCRPGPVCMDIKWHLELVEAEPKDQDNQP